MKDLIFSSSDLSVQPNSNDYVLDYLNFEEFDFDHSSVSDFQESDNLALRNIPLKNREGCNGLRNNSCPEPNIFGMGLKGVEVPNSFRSNDNTFCKVNMNIGVSMTNMGSNFNNSITYNDSNCQNSKHKSAVDFN